MSRETDSPSSGPNGSNGRGGAAYPSGTPPYGTPMVSDGGPDTGRSAARPEERKTETTLTTRIRINIPGSRPIPPVVVRTPVADADSAADDGGTDAQGTGPAGAAPATGATGRPGADGTAEAPGDHATAEEKMPSDWFAPRKAGAPAPKGAPGGGPANGAAPAGGSAPGTSSGAPAAPSAPSATGANSGAPGGGRPGAGRPGGVVGSMSAPGAPRPGGTNGAGMSGATGGPVAPGHGGGTGSFDVTEALAAGSHGNGTRPTQGGGQAQTAGPTQGAAPAQGSPVQRPMQSGPMQGGPSQGGGSEPRRDDLPYFDGGGNGQNGYYPGPNGQGGGPGAPGGPHDFNGPEGPAGRGSRGGPQGPAGPTGGPVTGDGPMVPPLNAGALHHPGGGLSDDTAILTPQQPAPEPGPGGYGRHDNVSGHTVTSGIPVVPATGQGPGQGGPFAPGGHPGGHLDGPLPHTPPKAPEPVAQNAPAADSKKKKKKGRSKLVLLGSLVVVAAAGAYGAGLLMNHSDVPKGTTVLGVDIGGGTRDDAVKKLDDAFDSRVNQPLKLSVDGGTVTLKPDQAGLQFDMQATVDAAAKSDYNPVSVIGSLFGEHREIEPDMPVDEEKLQAALETAAGGTGSATDGTITFQSGKAVAVYGKAGKGIDAAKAQAAVVEAYRGQVETGTPTAVKVPTKAKQPTVSDAEVDRMMKEFAEPAMSANVTVQTDAAHSVPMSPKNSLWKFLGVKAIDGKLVEKYDEAALKELYGGAFDGVLITRGNGQKTPVTVQDVISALRPALTSKTDRLGIIDTDPS
ncbi:MULTISPECIES: peptidoglycan binding domain-containing protein [Streptomyces]|uniref:Peptidoglycan binding domain-containing protein n=1 Tax=Streptomyces galilaeus TaxID=33899 RepID=A0ABW9IB71_STRGJ